MNILIAKVFLEVRSYSGNKLDRWWLKMNIIHKCVCMYAQCSATLSIWQRMQSIPPYVCDTTMNKIYIQMWRTLFSATSNETFWTLTVST